MLVMVNAGGAYLQWLGLFVYRYKPACTYVPAAVQQGWRSAAAVDAPPVPLPPIQLAQRRAEGVGPLLSMPIFVSCEGQAQSAT